MRARFLPAGLALALAVGVLTAAPAAAAYGVAVTFPGGGTEFYSPFDGPATIRFTFDPGDEPTAFNARIRPQGGTKIHDQDFVINPSSQTSPIDRHFSWPALSTGSDRIYEVVVVGGGDTLVVPFILKPRLVAITDVRPNPFLPWKDDGIKDTTRVTFDLGADADAEARVYRAKNDGKCCGALVLDDTADLGNLPAGENQWVWDGRDEGGDNLAKGDYFVKIAATDTDAVTKVSKPRKVTIARTYRALGKLSRNGIAYHHSGPVSVYRRGGNCFVTRDETDKDLWITCLSASFTVYWRWSLPSGARIEKESFVYVKVSGEICNGKKGHTKTDSYLKVGGVGQFRCRVDTARITYSYLKQS